MKNSGLLLRALVAEVARWELWPNRSDGRVAGELRVGGVSFVLDVQHGVPVLTDEARAQLEKALRTPASDRVDRGGEHK